MLIMIRKILFSVCAVLVLAAASAANAAHSFDVSPGESSGFSVNVELSADQANDTTAPTVVSMIPAEGETISNPPTVIINLVNRFKG